MRIINAIWSMALIATPLQASGQVRYQITRELRVGSIEGADYLTEPGDVAVNRDGMIFVAQPQEQLIRVFNSSGALSSTIGRRGGGPGEFRTITGMGIRGDSIWVSDGGNRKLSYFSKSGSLLSELSWGLPYRSPHTPIGAHYTTVQLRVNGQGERDMDRPWAVSLHDSRGEPVDTIAVVHAYSQVHQLRGRSVPNPLPDGALSDASPSGNMFIVVDRRTPTRGKQGQFVITWIGLSGDTLARRAFSYVAKPVPDNMMEVLAIRLSAAGAPQSAIDDMKQALRNVAFLPPISAMTISSDGERVWLARERLGQSVVRWHEFSRIDGNLGYIDLPSKSRVAAAGDSWLLVIEKDELDVSYVTRYRLSRSGR